MHEKIMRTKRLLIGLPSYVVEGVRCISENVIKKKKIKIRDVTCIVLISCDIRSNVPNSSFSIRSPLMNIRIHKGSPTQEEADFKTLEGHFLVESWTMESEGGK